MVLCCRMQEIRALACVLAAATLVLTVVATATSTWRVTEETFFRESFGIFISCRFQGYYRSCKLLDIASSEGWLHAVRFLMVFSIFTAFVALVLGILGFICISHKINQPKVAGALMILTGLLIMIAAALYTGFTRDTLGPGGVVLYWGYSYIIAWVCMVLALISGLLFFLVYDLPKDMWDPYEGSIYM